VKHVRAKICWTSIELSGKKILPKGTYSTASFFEGMPAGEGWSVTIHPETQPDENRCAIYDLCFLFGEDAPEDLLYTGNTFELFEGKKVANGVIL
jgi:hypothetical protein